MSIRMTYPLMSDFRRLAALVALCLASVTAVADDPKPVRYLSYENCGAYTVKKVKLHWKANGSSEKTTVGSNLEGYYHTWAPKNNGVCVDLTDDKYGIPEGAEVWLSYDIESGDSKSCRKDTALVFSGSTAKGEFQRSRGETLTNNRCRNRAYALVAKPSECSAVYDATC